MIGIGTQALIQAGVEFRRLGLVVVDEQHRFGVRQRMALAERSDPGGQPDVLVMSATPIPRSLALVLYGDLDMSVLDEVPPGRTRVETTLRYPRTRPQVYARVEEELEKGRQGYVVFPLIEESEKLALKSATREYDRLRTEVFQNRRVGLLHGQLTGGEKEEAMRAFREGEIDVMVATSVVEVGIDVPNATFMVIEHADRFGLSQLHQLRGRVGRGSHESICILVAEPGDQAAERLRVFCRTRDGFAIARADLQIRGQGDLFGAQQHGRDPILRFADLRTDESLLEPARKLARAIIDRDPEIASPANARIRSTLEERHAERPPPLAGRVRFSGRVSEWIRPRSREDHPAHVGDGAPLSKVPRMTSSRSVSQDAPGVAPNVQMARRPIRPAGVLARRCATQSHRVDVCLGETSPLSNSGSPVILASA